jgi:hypothetical protein
MPAVIAVISDAPIRKSPKIHPSSEYVIMKLSAPTWGVEMRNDMVAPFDAPLFLREAATGTTPQEHNGMGIPNNVDFITEEKESRPRCRRIMDSGKITWSTPAMVKPKIRYIDTSFKKKRVSFIKRTRKLIGFPY